MNRRCHERLLHDGRARGVLGAVMWHDGEARESSEHAHGLSAADRHTLVRFARSS